MCVCSTSSAFLGKGCHLGVQLYKTVVIKQWTVSVCLWVNTCWRFIVLSFRHMPDSCLTVLVWNFNIFQKYVFIFIYFSRCIIKIFLIATVEEAGNSWMINLGPTLPFCPVCYCLYITIGLVEKNVVSANTDTNKKWGTVCLCFEWWISAIVNVNIYVHWCYWHSVTVWTL